MSANMTAVEIAKYHIHPDVLAQHPFLEDWAASHDAYDGGSVIDGLVEELQADDDTLEVIELFLRGLPDSAKVKWAIESVVENRRQHDALVTFREECSDTLDVSDDDNAEARILESIRLGEKLRQLQTLRASPELSIEERDEESELLEELGLS